MEEELDDHVSKNPNLHPYLTDSENKPMEIGEFYHFNDEFQYDRIIYIKEGFKVDSLVLNEEPDDGKNLKNFDMDYLFYQFKDWNKHFKKIYLSDFIEKYQDHKEAVEFIEAKMKGK